MAILIYLNAVPQSAAFAEKTSVSVMPFSEYSGVREDLALDRHCQRRDRRARYGFVANGPVDLDQYLLSGIYALGASEFRPMRRNDALRIVARGADKEEGCGM